jgi:hypothetical protein
MAEGKKSVLLYCDLIHTIEKMDNETAGQFFKHYLRYINDLNPETDNLLVDITFESVKQNLKRDLKKWETRAEKSRENGKKGGRPPKEETQETQQVILKPKKPVKDTVTVTVTDTVNVNDILLKKETKKDLVFPFHSENFVYQWQIWKTYKKEQHRFTYKSEATEQAALTQLQKMATNQERKAIEILHHTMANGWKGFVEPKTDPRKETQEAFQAVKDKINFDFSDGKLSFER